MNGSTSTALVPIAPAAEPEKSAGCGGKRSLLAGRVKWLVLAAAALAIAGLALGSGVLGLAAILPLLYVLPCLLMLAMCMKGHGKGSAPTTAMRGTDKGPG